MPRGIMHKDKPYSRSMPVDTALHEDSYNPVQNKVVAKAIGIELGPVNLRATTGVTTQTVSFTHANIKETSELRLFSENPTNTPVFWNSVAVSVSNGVGTATYTIPALTLAQDNTNFYLRVVNSFPMAV